MALSLAAIASDLHNVRVYNATADALCIHSITKPQSLASSKLYNVMNFFTCGFTGSGQKLNKVYMAADPKSTG